MVQSAAANLQRLEELESFKRVYAPFAGVITKRNVDIGTLINAGNGGTSTREMFDLAQTDPLRVYVAAPQTFANTIHDGMKACLELSEFPGQNFCGKVVRSAGAVDPTTRTLLTEVDVPNPSNVLLEGEYAQVHFDAKLAGEHLSVPNNALLFRPAGTMVAVVDPKQYRPEKAHHRPRLGHQRGSPGGITANDAFVINPPDAIDQGQQVTISPPSASTGS